MRQTKPSVGILVNPASGRDVRRLVAKASVFQNTEKCNMVYRILGALGILGVEEVFMMPDVGGVACHYNSLASTWPAWKSGIHADRTFPGNAY